MSHVFLSYSRLDQEIARRVIADLESAGLRVWSDHKLDLGGFWHTELHSAIRTAVAVVLLVSPSSTDSRWIKDELNTAQVDCVPIIPMLTGGARFGDLPAELAAVNGVDLDEDYDGALRKVVSALAMHAVQNSEAGDHLSTFLVLADTASAAVVTEMVRGMSTGALISEKSDVSVRVAQRAIESLQDADTVLVALQGPPAFAYFMAGYSAGSGKQTLIWDIDSDSAPIRSPRLRHIESLDQSIISPYFFSSIASVEILRMK